MKWLLTAQVACGHEPEQLRHTPHKVWLSHFLDWRLSEATSSPQASTSLSVSCKGGTKIGPRLISFLRRSLLWWFISREKWLQNGCLGNDLILYCSIECHSNAFSDLVTFLLNFWLQNIWTSHVLLRIFPLLSNTLHFYPILSILLDQWLSSYSPVPGRASVTC